MNIRTANESERVKWDNFAAAHPSASAYHLSGWTTAIQNAYGFRQFNLIAEEDGEILGIFPLTMMKIPFKRPELVALPYCDVGAPLALTLDIQTQLLQEAIAIAKNNNASSIEVRGEIDHGCLQYIGLPVQVTNQKVRMFLELPSSSAELWKGFTSKLRSQIRKAEKNGLTFRFCNEKIEDFYSVFTINMRDLGSPVHSKKWFEEVVKQYSENVNVGVVYNNDQAIGAGILLRIGNKMAIPWASTLRRFNHLSPNMMLYWKFLEHASDTGIRIFDFGRSTPDEGTYKFKSQWGATPAALTWQTFFLDGSIPKNTSKQSRYREIAEKNWQRLPVGLANLFGPFLRKYIKL